MAGASGSWEENSWADQNLIDNFVNQVRNWNGRVQAIAQLPTYNDSSLSAKKQKLLSDAAGWKSKIVAITNGIDELKKAVGLGVAWMVPVALVAGITAILGGLYVWNKNADTFASEQALSAQAYADTIKAGGSPTQATQNARTIKDDIKNAIDSWDWKKWAGVGLIGVAALMLLSGGNKSGSGGVTIIGGPGK